MPIKFNKLICSILLLSLFIFPVQASAVSIDDFSDVGSQDWYVKDGSLPYCLEHGIVNGYDGKFAPQESLTVEQFIAVMTRVVKDTWPTLYAKHEQEYNASYDSSHPFGYEGWADKELYIAHALGISDGFGEPSNKAAWTAPITRFEMSQLTANTMLGPLMEYTRDASSVPSQFTDGSSIEASPYKDGVGVVVTHGIVQGSKGVFDGDRVLVRSELCAVVYRLMEPGERIEYKVPIAPLLPEQDHITYENGKGAGQRLPIEGDKIIIDGTEYELKVDPTTGILGFDLYGKGVDYFSGNIDDKGRECKVGKVAMVDTTGQSGCLLAGPDGSVFTSEQWFLIKSSTYPTSDGVDGQKSADGLWEYTNRYHEWSWIGPKI